MNHYQRHVGDYIRDTVGLSMLEEGAYTRLLDQYYVTEAPLPLDRAKLYRMARAASKPERSAVDVVMAQFFLRSTDGYRQKRADQELQAIYKRSDSARESAEKRWASRNANAPANAMPTQCNGNASEHANGMLPITHYPLPTKATHPPDAPLPHPSGSVRTKFDLPEWLSAELWSAFLEHRKKLRKPMTDRAQRLMIKSLGDMRAKGHQPDKLLEEALVRGWLAPVDPADRFASSRPAPPAGMDRGEVL